MSTVKLCTCKIHHTISVTEEPTPAQFSLVCSHCYKELHAVYYKAALMTYKLGLVHGERNQKAKVLDALGISPVGPTDIWGM